MISKIIFLFLLIGSTSVISQTVGLTCKDEKNGPEKFMVIDLTKKTIKYYYYIQLFPIEITDSEIKWKIKNDMRVSDSSYEGHTYFQLNRFNLRMEEFAIFYISFYGGNSPTHTSIYNCKLHQKVF